MNAHWPASGKTSNGLLRSRGQRRRLALERLEERALMAVDISIGDASAIEGSDALKFIDRFVSDSSGGLARSRGLTFGPDGNGDAVPDLYVASVDTDEILRYDAIGGGFLDTFVTSGSGGLDGPGDLAFGPDGNLYVSNYGGASGGGTSVIRYDGTTGALIDTPVTGLLSPLGLTFGPDGGLYIANQGTDEILRFDTTGLSVFVAAGSGGLITPRQAVFGPDGNLYVASQGTRQVLRYDGVTGAFVDEFASTNFGTLGDGPTWLEFGTDGYLYATARNGGANFDTSILRFDADTGDFVDSFALGRDGWSFIVGPDNIIYNSSNKPIGFVDRFGASSLAAFTVSLSALSDTPVTVQYSTASGTAGAGTDFVEVAGEVTFAIGQTLRTILVSTIDNAAIELNETFTINLSGAVGGSIVDSQGVGTIVDNDTKFYVVDDAATNRSYEYQDIGAAGENYTLASGNTAPRGAASTAAGDKVWVVDNNRSVYVYDPSGALLGSWTAGTLAVNAQPHGIATDGTDIWIVDAKSDKVFKYTGAASRLSGSQNASSFSLNTGNKDATDIVTDGASLWVTNDATQNKVFKYTVAGGLLGSWTIDAASSTPTGITIDPSNVSDIWIVDAGTDRVYQYTAAASRTSGSQSAAVSFALAADNTNPQGIADPPVGQALIDGQTEAAEMAELLAGWDLPAARAPDDRESLSSSGWATGGTPRQAPSLPQVQAIAVALAGDDESDWMPPTAQAEDMAFELNLLDQLYAQIGQS